MRKRLSTRALFAIGATALLCGAVLLWRFAPQPSETAVADTAAATATAEPGPAAHGQRPTPSMQVLTVHAQPTRADSSALPPSLRGSQPDGDIRFDDTGGLVIDRGLRHRFDYWLTGLGEVSLKALRERFERSLGTELSPDQIERVLAEFDLYTEYLMAADDLLPVEFGSLVERHRALMALQRQLLGDSRADAWFGEQNRYIDHTLAAMDPGDQNADPIDEPWAAEIDAPTRHHSALALNSPSVRETVSPEILHE
ncbi:MAG: lipase secretion chaperone, partial [Wenzhouxiangellaceae bacterium]